MAAIVSAVALRIATYLSLVVRALLGSELLPENRYSPLKQAKCKLYDAKPPAISRTSTTIRWPRLAHFASF
jgi:hypothetical protein